MKYTLRQFAYSAGLLFLVAATPLVAAEPSDEPKAIPATRPQIKDALEKLKHREPRLPLPAMTDEEKQAAGDRIIVNNGRTRALYLPESWRTTSGGSQGDPSMTLEYPFKTQLFWIVSRGNNCHYCLGHQEHKLAAVGMDDDTIAALDSDWSRFPASSQAAMALARKMTLEPHAITTADIETLKPHFSDAQIIELVFTIASYNSTNRWTDSLGIPQDHQFRGEEVHFNQPTSPQFVSALSIATAPPNGKRPPMESHEEVAAAIANARARQPRVALLSPEAARQAVSAEWSAEQMPQWAIALAQFPQSGGRYIGTLKAMLRDGDLNPRLVAELAHVSARNNRAWYALAHADALLTKQGLTRDQIDALDGSLEELTAAEREALEFAKKLTVTSWKMTDADIARLREHYNPRQTAQIVQVVCTANFFDRFTETLGLQVEPWLP